MKFTILMFVAFFACALSAPADVHIVRSDSEVEADHYTFNVETSDGKAHHQEGKLKDVGTEHPALIVSGSYSWKDEHDGQVYTVHFVADEHGYRPVGDHLPPLPKPVL